MVENRTINFFGAQPGRDGAIPDIMAGASEWLCNDPIGGTAVWREKVKLAATLACSTSQCR